MSFSRRLTLIASLLLIGCGEDATGPGAGGYPARLYPYQVFYDSAVFKQRRDSLVQLLPAGAIVFVSTNDVYLRNGDLDYEFRPSSAFYYLTGFEEPNAVAVIRRKPAPRTGSELVMFVEERTGTLVQWLGPVHGPQGVVEHFGADSGYGVGTWQTRLSAYVGSGTVQSVYANLAENGSVMESFDSLGLGTGAAADVRPFVERMRGVKSAPEIESVRRAVAVTVQAFDEAIRAAKPEMYEHEVQAILEFVARLNGAPRLAFPTIVASGPNLVTLHYFANSRKMLSGDLAMVDFGVEYGYYTADVTRTIPIGGAFGTDQATIYDIVKAARDTVIASSRPGVTYAALSALSRDVIVAGLVRAGVVTGSASTIISSGQYRLYIPAALGHPVGLDTHDPWPQDAANRALVPGMLIAYEPHVYLSPGDSTVAARYRGLAARIEDVVLITSAGHEVLSGALPATRAGIEALMR
jgi:Xaa-Pro aminopeptidase